MRFDRRIVTALSLGAFAAVSSFGSGALAQPTADQKAAAQALFEEARTLMDQGKFADACPRLAESNRLDHGMATQFRLAECHEKEGKLASAWTHFVEVADEARAQGMSDREKVARDRADALRPRLSKLTVAVPDAVRSTTGLEVKRNGVVLGAAQWGAAIPVDGGKHTIEASAPGKRAWSKAVDVPAEKGAVSVEVEALADAPADEQHKGGYPPGGAPPATGSDGSAQRIAGILVGGLGVVGIGVGIGLGVAAKGSYDDSEGLCNDDNLCSQEGLDIRDDARSLGNIATGVFIAGAVMAAAGVVIIVTAPSSPSAPTGADAALVVKPGGLGFRARF